MTDLRDKTMNFYTFSVRPTIANSKKVKIMMKRFDEEKNEDFFEDKYFNFDELIFGEEKIFWKNFRSRWCIFSRTKHRFSENFCKSFFISKS